MLMWVLNLDFAGGDGGGAGGTPAGRRSMLLLIGVGAWATLFVVAEAAWNTLSSAWSSRP